MGLLCCVLLRPTFATAQTDPPQELHLVLLAGQSNMAGRGKVSDLDAKPHPRVLMLNREGEWVPAVDPLHFDKPKLVGVGPGKSFALAYAEAHPDVTVGLVPCAVGGSPIDSWAPGGFHKSTQSHPFDDAVARIQKALRSGRFKAILWHQGESDCKPERVPAYEAGLTDTIARLRAAAGDSTVPVLIGGLGDFQARTWSDSRRSIDAIHKGVASKLSNAEFVSSLGLVAKPDNVHFDAKSCREFGVRYYAAFERLSQPAKLLRVQRIWDQAPHCAFTDLVHTQDAWLCVFREGKQHVSPDGSIRVLQSSDGTTWKSACLITDEHADLRDPKLTVTPDGQLMLTAASAKKDGDGTTRHQTQVWFSTDGKEWSEPKPIGKAGHWLWRVAWQANNAYSVGYRTGTSRGTVLYRSMDGVDFTPLVPDFFEVGYPNESSIVFGPNHRAYCLLRRDPRGDQGTAKIGQSYPPYEDWKWTDLGVRLGGPVMTLLPDGRLLAVVRLYDGQTRTSLCWVDPLQGDLQEFLPLPSGGDTSYAGVVYKDGLLWISYYSSHERDQGDFQSAIYLAQVHLP